MEKLKMHSPNLINANIEKIKKIFPNCITESQDESGKPKLAIDFDQLRQELSDSIVEGPQERYCINWPGKREAMLTANTPIAKTLRPSKDESVNFDTTQNLFIEGDNLEALKLLQETYSSKVKMIYIDPPYNTGKDFVYKDNFAQNSEEFLRKSNQKDDQGNRLVANTEKNGRFHSDWLSMVYPRLKLARDLLRDDGVIFISIDDNEQANLKKLCDEVFGEENVETYIWYLNDSSEGSFIKTPSKTVRNEHEYIIACFKSINFKQLGKYLDYRYKGKRNFTNLDNDPRGDWMSGNISRNGIKTTTGSKYFTITTPTGVEYSRNWTISCEEYLELMKDNRLYFSNGGDGVPRLKIFQNEPQENVQSSIFRELRSSSTGKKEVSELFNDNELFQFPKPTTLIQRLLIIANSKNEIILDFFAGSGTTAHAVMQLNAEDGGNRKCISVQLPELTDEKSESHKAGYKNIAEISKERIRRAGKKILEGNCHENWNKDVGFRVLKVDSSNMTDIYYSPDKTTQLDLLNLVNNIKPDRKPEDLLFQVLLDLGVDLTLPISRQNILGKTVFFINQEPFDLVACFDNEISEELVKEIAKTKPLKAFKQMSPSTDIKAI